MSASTKRAVQPAVPASAPEAPSPNPCRGTFARSDDGKYRGWIECTRCDAISQIVGVKRTAEESPTGEFIELAISGHGRHDAGELRGKWLRATLPCCRAYNQLAVEIDRADPKTPVAVFLKPGRAAS